MSGTCLTRSRAVVCTPRLELVHRTSRFTKQCSTYNTQWRAPHRRFRVLTRAEAENESEGNPESTDYKQASDEPTFVGKLFGSYLQLAVWIVTLSFAGYKGIQLAQTDPSSVGLLIAPPAGALFLIITFLFYRFGGKK